MYTAGDSFAEWLGYQMGSYGKQTRLLAPRLDFRISTGLVASNYFNWPNRINQTMTSEQRPEAIIFFIGANDNQNFFLGNRILPLLTPEWKAEYARRAGVIMDLIGQHGGRLYWVNLPVMRDPTRNAVVNEINSALAEEAGKREWVTIVDIWPLFAEDDGSFATYRPGPDGELVRARQDDGVHLTRIGTDWVATRVYKAMQDDWRLPSLQ